MRNFLAETNSFFSQFMPTATRRFFYICVFMSFTFWILDALFMGFGAERGLLRRVFVLIPEQAILQGHVWQFLTGIFVHQDFFHLLSNMLVLFFFGTLVEDRMGSRRFAWLLVLIGILGGLVHSGIVFALGRPHVGLLGFSGACFGVLTLAALWYPNQRVLLMLMFPIPLRILAVILGIFLGIGLLENFRMYGFMGYAGGGISHEVHLVGVLTALALTKWGGLLNWLDGLRLPFLDRGARIIPIGKSRRGGKGGAKRFSMGHPGRHTDPDDLYNDPHWYLDQ